MLLTISPVPINRLCYFIIRVMKWMLDALDCALFWLVCWALYAVVLFWIKPIDLSTSLIKFERPIKRKIKLSFLLQQNRETTLAVYAFSAVGMWVYTFTLNAGHISVVYITSSLLGYVLNENVIKSFFKKACASTNSTTLSTSNCFTSDFS